MATVDKHELLFITDLKYFKDLQLIGNKPIFDRYKIAETSIIDKYINDRYRNFLAYPVRDSDRIEFHGIKARNEDPRILSELQGEDAEKYQNLKIETTQHYLSVINELKNANKSIEAEFLTDAIKFVDDRFVYCYDDTVVLGAWGMQMRENVDEDITVIRKKSPLKIKKTKKEPEVQHESEVFLPIAPFNVSFNAGENGILQGNDFITKDANSYLGDDEIPQVEPKDGYEFIGWSEDPHGCQVSEDKEFTAQYRQKEFPPIVEKKLPWWKRFWLWLCGLWAGKGCLKWLLRLLLFILLLLLLLWLLRNCHGCSHSLPVGGAALGGNDSTWLREDPNVGNGGGIYDPINPYNPVPTPPGYENVLPPQQGVLLPIEDDTEILPGNPTIIANRLNILMENEDKSILDLAKDFKAKYPGEKYQVIYYDDVVKRMQIKIPKEEREQLKQAIPGQFSPDYELFVFDEALFEGVYMPNDPAFNDPDKSWYLKTINAPQAWDITRGSEKITVAIIDNGFNLKHPELSNKVVQPYNVWRHSDEIFPQQIDHGTHVAGTALAIADNGKGICGVAPNCKFMPIQVADARGMMTTTSVLDGILYALYQGADVVNVSLGSQFISLSQFSESVQQDLIRNHFKEEERLWREIMRIAARHNSTIVVAAGNDNVLAGIDALQRPELFITVSATDKNNRGVSKAEFSNYGSFSTISAPGVSIYSSIGKNDYQIMDGTSMAAPIVSGAVALMKSINDTITTKQIICVLRATGLETQGNIGELIQLDKALEKVKSGEIVPCPTPVPTTGDVQVLLNWNNYNDLDLIVTDPYNEQVWFKNRRVSSGGQLEIDMNVEYPDSKTPVENIYWGQGGAPNGTYNVYLLYYRRHEPQIDSTPYNIKVKYGGKTEEYSGEIKKADKIFHICTFTLGTAENPAAQLPDTSPANDRKAQLEVERDRLQKELDRVNNELRRIGNGR
ncbi:MAG: S8 family serine peptidase [Candidatus Azobacteroides sp.]|nr:S8 family serine peptidase [Candidatus Azobacteroides sp.]